MRQHVLNNEMRLNLYFEMTGDFRRMDKRQGVKFINVPSSHSECEVPAGMSAKVHGDGNEVLQVMHAEVHAEESGERGSEVIVEVAGRESGEKEVESEMRVEEEEEETAYVTAEEGESGNRGGDTDDILLDQIGGENGGETGGEIDDTLLDEVSENMPPVESDFLADTDTAFKRIVNRVIDILDPNNVKVEMEVNVFKGCALYNFS